jgi:hypothetical protein
LKNERLSYPRPLLEALDQVKQDGLRNVITGDESWLFLFDPRDSDWAESRFEVPPRTNEKLGTEKCLVSVP